MSSPGSVGGNERLRLFLALRLPPNVLDAIVSWQELELGEPAHQEVLRVVPREHLHVTLAFLGSRPARELEGIVAALEASAREAASIELAIDRYRETKSVGMLVLRDATGAATALADDLQTRLEALRVYRRESRRWLLHLTAVRFRDRPRLHVSPLLGVFAPSDAAVFLSRLHPSGARYEVLETCALHPLR